MNSNDLDLMKQIANEELASENNSPYDYNKKESAFSTRYAYKVWNPNPQKPESIDPNTKEVINPSTPGIVIRATTKSGNERKVEQTIVDRVNIVVLFAAPARKLTRGAGPAFTTVCSSHDGHEPSISIKEPLCRKATKNDLVQIFSKWKGYDQAKVDAKVAEVVDENGSLQICGLKTNTGFISLCPYSRRDPVSGAKASCKEYVYVRAFDLDRQVEFNMELSGQSIQHSQKYISPFHEFFSYLKQQGALVDGRPKGLPSYVFKLQLSALKVGAYYVANFSNWTPIAKTENREIMKQKAIKAKENYDRFQFRLEQKDMEARSGQIAKRVDIPNNNDERQVSNVNSQLALSGSSSAKPTDDDEPPVANFAKVQKEEPQEVDSEDPFANMEDF